MNVTLTCARCARDNPAGSRFCEGCGTSLGLACANCGQVVATGVRFCGQCGTPRPPEITPKATQAPHSVGPAAYTPKHLADKILRSRSAIEGERKQVTILLADLKESMTLSEAVDVETWHEVMDGFFEILTAGIHRFEGTINQYTGDGVMALFGAPIAHEDHAQRACYAALRLSEEFERYARDVKRRHGLGFSVRIGLNSGEVVVGRIGDDLRMDYTAQGHTVGLAARMEQLADPGKTYLTAHTARLVRGYFELESLGDFTIKGASEPIGAFVLKGTGAIRTRLDLSRARGFSGFVGRASEMTTLDAALEKSLAGNGQVVGVVGEAGVGKSRLCYELVEKCRARGIVVAESHCVAHGKLVPLMPILELLRNLFGITDSDSERDARRKIAGSLVLLADVVGEDLALVLDLMGVPDPERPVPVMDAEVRQRRLFSLLKRVVRARSEREPHVILMDDVHWIDPSSDVFLAQWVDAILGTRTLLVLNFRPEYRAEWMGKSFYQQLALQPLSADVAKVLLREMLGSDSSLDGLGERMFERSGGNPFFIEEIVQSLVESEKLVGERGAYRVNGSFAELAIPSTVQTILAARIDRAPEREKRVLQTASVIGHIVPEPILKRVLDLDDTELGASLRFLTDSEFMFERAIYPDVEFSFKHPLTLEVAYGSQLLEKRRRTHAAVAAAIAEFEPGKLDERAALLAHHWQSAGDAWKAAEWHGRAGEWSRRSDSKAALQHWRSAWDQLLTTDQSSARDQLLVRAGIQILTYGLRAGMSAEEINAIFEHGRHLAERLDDVSLRVLLNYRYMGAAVLAGVPSTKLRDVSAETTRLAATSDDRAVRLTGAYVKAMWDTAGRISDMIADLDTAAALCGDDPTVGASYLGEMLYRRILWSRVQLLANAGRMRDAQRDRDRLLQLAVEFGDVEPDFWVLAHGVSVQLGDVGRSTPEQCLVHARELSAVAERSGAAVNRVYAYAMLAVAHVFNGRWHDAIESGEQALSIQKTTRTAVPFETYMLCTLAQACVETGDSRRALESVERAVALALAFGVPRFEVHCRITHAAVLLRIGDSASRAAARATLKSAARVAHDIGGRAFEPLILEQSAELARLEGDDTAWRTELRTAQRLFAEMEMTGRAEQAAARLASAETH